jgi:DNA invertase Pin-like site-specific DNA recombinase
MNIGYARVSTREQNTALQLDALKAAGCTKVLTEVASGAATDRPILAHLLDDARPGDVIVIWKLDRLGRSLKHLIDVVGTLLERDVGLKSLNDPVDTTTAQGRLVFNLFASLAEFERDVIRERTQAGLSAARARGRKGGRPKGLSAKAEPTAYAAETLYREGRLSSEQIAQRLHIAKSTLYAYLRHRGVPVGVRPAR